MKLVRWGLNGEEKPGIFDLPLGRNLQKLPRLQFFNFFKNTERTGNKLQV